jgi:hypothetical protein
MTVLKPSEPKVKNGSTPGKAKHAPVLERAENLFVRTS